MAVTEEAQREEEASFVADDDAPAAPAVPNAPSARVTTATSFGVAGIGQGETGPAKKGSNSSNNNNNYVRSEGQNVGNFLTGRPSSKVLAPPGGRSSITFG